MAATSSPVVRRAQDHVRGIDGMRGIAAVMVLVFHVWTQAGFPALDGWIIRDFVGANYLGVDLFFVLSGFVLFLPMVRRGGPGSGRGYAIRRFGRVAPAYYLTLFIAVAFRPWVHLFPSDAKFVSTTGLAHVLLLQTPALGNSVDTGFGGATQLWTLSHEVLFYVALYFVGAAFARRPVVGFSIALAVSVAWRVALVHFIHDPEVMRDVAIQVPSYVLHFALGMVVAVTHVRMPDDAKQRFQRWAPWILFTAFASVCALVVRAGMHGFNGTEGAGDHHLRNLGVATGFAVILLCVVNGPTWIADKLDHRALRWLGEISYGVYLFHLFVIGFALWLWGGPPVPNAIATNQMFFALLGWTLPMTCILARLSYDYLEQPIREMLRKASARLATEQRVAGVTGARQRARQARTSVR